MTDFKVGDVVWVDEGDSYDCFEFGGVIEQIREDGWLGIRCESHPIGCGVPTGALRFTPPEGAELSDEWRIV